jgi:hypothetical protein
VQQALLVPQVLRVWTATPVTRVQRAKQEEPAKRELQVHEAQPVLQVQQVQLETPELPETLELQEQRVSPAKLAKPA